MWPAPDRKIEGPTSKAALYRASAVAVSRGDRARALAVRSRLPVPLRLALATWPGVVRGPGRRPRCRDGDPTLAAAISAHRRERAEPFPGRRCAVAIIPTVPVGDRPVPPGKGYAICGGMGSRISAYQSSS